jgi:hypothetical protein
MGGSIRYIWRKLKRCWAYFLRVTNENGPAIIAIFTVFLVIVGYLQYQILKSSDENLRETKESKRPWIAFDNSEFYVLEKQINEDGGHIVVRIDGVKNGGDTAAIGVNVAAKALKFGPIPKTAKTIADAIDSPCTSGAAKRYDEGEIVLPGQTISLGPVIFTALKHEYDGDNIWIAGCIGYQGSDRRPHATTFAYRLNQFGRFERIYGISSGGY